MKINHANQIEHYLRISSKGPADFAAFTARLKSCSDTKRLFETHSTSFSAACKASVDSVDVLRGLKPPPPSGMSFSAACEVVP
jgi:hypothetical protein